MLLLLLITFLTTTYSTHNLFIWWYNVSKRTDEQTHIILLIIKIKYNALLNFTGAGTTPCYVKLPTTTEGSSSNIGWSLQLLFGLLSSVDALLVWFLIVKVSAAVTTGFFTIWLQFKCIIHLLKIKLVCTSKSTGSALKLHSSEYFIRRGRRYLDY